jgi:hypothetical protein
MGFPIEPSTVSASDGDPILARWLEALRQDAPNLPAPIAVAMAQGVTRGPLGQPLRHIEQALMQIEDSNLSDLTGSEVRVLAAILHRMNRTILNLDAEIARLYTVTEQ